MNKFAKPLAAIALSGASAFALATGALAQTQNTPPAQNQSQQNRDNQNQAPSLSIGEKTGVNSMLGITPSTSDFVKEAAASDMFEIQSSQLALTKGDPKIKTFAQMMVDDHTKTSTELKSAAGKANAQVPTAMATSQQRMVDNLKDDSNSGDFTRRYLDDQVSAHEDAVSLFERYSKGGDNAELKSWAEKTLPKLREHLKMAQDLQNSARNTSGGNNRDSGARNTSGATAPASPATTAPAPGTTTGTGTGTDRR